MTRWSPRLAALLLALSVGSCAETTPATQVIVVVNSDLVAGTEVDTLEVRLLERDDLGNGAEPHRTFSVEAEPTQGQHAFPLSFSVAPKDPGSNQDFRLIVTGLRGKEKEAVVEQQAIAAFQPGRSMQLTMFLARGCLEELCRDPDSDERTSEACFADGDAAVCSEVQYSQMLDEWEGSGSELEGEGLDGGGNADPGVDATADVDAVDAGGADGGSLGCEPGFTRVGGECQDVDECDADPDVCGAADCTNRPGGYACGDCPRGYAPDDTGACLDIDECDVGSDHCDAHADCENTEGGFGCSCPKGYGGNGRGAQGCVPLPSDLGFSFGALTPAYDPDVTEYSLDVGIWLEEVELQVLLDEGPALTVDGTAQTPGLARVLPLDLGQNQVRIEVARGSFSRTYNVTVTRGEPVEHYLKASNTGEGDGLGSSVSLSDDGLTLAVGAYLEDSNSTGVDSAANDSADSAGAVYVFVRSGDGWSQQAYLKASNAGEGDEFGQALSLSGDGATLAVGASREDSGGTGVDSTPNDDASNSGAVYVFVRSANRWSQQAYLKASNAGAEDWFGCAVSLNGDGSTLAVGAYGEDSATTGGASMPDDSANSAGAAYVFVRSSESWSQQAYLKGSNTGADDWFGSAVSLSDDGSTLAVGASAEDSATQGVDTVPNDDASNAGAVYVFVHDGEGWSQQAYLKASNAGASDRFGEALSLSDDGSTLAVGAYAEDSDTTGVDPSSNSQAGNAGAAYVFERSSGSWQQQAFLKASNTGQGDRFGWSVSLSGDGATLAVGAYTENSSTTGINSTPNRSLNDAGAVYVFTRSGAQWSQRAYVKASIPGGGDQFGGAVSLNEDGSAMAVAAPLEDSDTVGIDSTPNDLSVDTGAVYVFQPL